MRVMSQGKYNEMAFNVMAQEIVRTNRLDEIIGYELTIRPCGGGSAAQVIDLAKSPDDRVDLDLAILTAFRKIERTLDLKKPLDLWINIFPSTLMSSSVLAKLTNMIKASMHNFVVEITESEFLTDYGTARRSVKAIQKAGAKVVLDDFGSGAASIQTLLELPVDGIKVDRVVFQQAVLDQRFMPLIEGTVATAKMLDIPVVIEGIETLSHLSIARMLNAEYIQGYFVSRPASIPDTLDSIEFRRQLAAYELRRAKRGESPTADESTDQRVLASLPRRAARSSDFDRLYP